MLNSRLLLLVAERSDVSYSLVAVDFLDKRAVNAALIRLSGQLAAGTLRPLPQVVHSLSHVQAALRQMSQARHVGKIVTRVPVASPAHGSSVGSVLVTGGLGTLGSLTAAWLAQHTKHSICATGRTGHFSTLSSTLAKLMASRYIGQITLTSGDAASAADAMLLATATGRQFVGLVHASGVLADGTLANQSVRGIRKVFAPKSEALRQLQRLTVVQPAEFEVLFSSIASLLGSPGQSNYSAANAALDALAKQRQEQVGWRFVTKRIN